MTPLHHDAGTPSLWVARFAPLIRPGGAVLDLACGAGRHGRFLASRGHPVTALDRDAAALAPLARVARVTAVEADLEAGPWPLPGRTFDAVVVTSYLHRPLFPAIAAALSEGGLLLYETYMRGNERFGKPSNPDFLLAPGELLAAFAGLSVVAFEQGEVAAPRPAVVQRLCAVRGPVDGLALPRGA